MTRLRTFSFLLLGSLIAIVAGIATFSYTRSIENQLMTANAAISAYNDAASVPVLLIDAPRGSKLSARDFGSTMVVRNHMPTNVLQSLPELAVGASLVSFSDLKAGALLLESSLGLTPPNPDLGLVLSNDGRAVSVMPRNFESISEFTKVDSLVDLFWTRETPTGSETRLIGNAMRVLYLPAKDHKSEDISTIPRLILEANMRDAARILAANPQGFFSVLPAKGIVSDGASTIEVNVNDLNELPLAVRVASPQGDDTLISATATAPPVEAKCQMSIVRAGHRSAIEVPC